MSDLIRAVMSCTTLSICENMHVMQRTDTQMPSNTCKPPPSYLLLHASPFSLSPHPYSFIHTAHVHITMLSLLYHATPPLYLYRSRQVHIHHWPPSADSTLPSTYATELNVETLSWSAFASD